MKRRIKVFLSLLYTVIFLVLASTGFLHTQAGELESAPASLNLLADPVVIEIEQLKD